MTTWVRHGLVHSAAALLFWSLLAGPARTDPDVSKGAVMAPLASRSLLLDAAVAGDRIVAVGARGHVLLSEDEGVTWRQVPVPTRATLTAISFDGDLGYAVGHDAVILRSSDAGSTWQQTFFDPEQERPLLDVVIVGEGRAIAVGAYGFYLETASEGERWSERIVKSVPWGEEADSEAGAALEDEQLSDDFHLNSIRIAETGTWYMAAEAGTIYRSDDKGGSWQRMPSPYDGTFFDVLPLSDESLLLVGLQGKIYQSHDAARSWAEVESPTRAILFDAVRLRDGDLAIVGASGTVLIGDPEQGLSLHQQPDRAAIARVVELENGDLMLFGEAGATLMSRDQ